MQYLRFRRFFVLLSTNGEHDVFCPETKVEDIRRKPIQCFGYSIGCYFGKNRAWHPSVRIELKLYKEVKEQLMTIATQKSIETLRRRFEHLPFEPYSPVRRQIVALLTCVNHA